MTRELLEALKDGEPTAFVELVMVYTVKLRRIAMTFFKNPFEQEEALQETFLHIFRQRATIDPSRADEFEGFVTTLARRKMIDILRATHPEQALGLAATAGMESPPNPHQIAETRDLEQIMSRFEQRLDPTLQPYFRAVFINGQDEDEVRISLDMGRRRARYVKSVLVQKLRKHHPLVEHLKQTRGGPT